MPLTKLDKLAILRRMQVFLTKASFDYYIMDDPLMSDGDFDKMEKRFNLFANDLKLNIKFKRNSCYDLNNPFLDKRRLEILKNKS